MTDFEDRDDLEQYAGDLADQVFMRAAIRTAVHAVLTLLVFLIVDLGLRVVAVLALFVVPRAAAVFLGVVFAVDVGWQAVAVVRHLRRNPPGRDRGLDRRERATVYAQRLRTAQAELQRDRTWPRRLRRPSWWRNQAVIAVYLGCLAVVVATWTSSPALGVSTAGITTALTLLTRRLLRGSAVAGTRLAQFGDLTAPKPTPEI